MGKYRFAAIVLAAGYSSRMGRFKPLLPIDGRSVLQHTIGTFESIGTENIYVVTGHRALETGAAAQASGARVVENPKFTDGMFSSVQAGIRCLDIHAIDAFFITPADICLIRPLTVRLLAAAYEKHPGAIIHPCLGLQRGHPPLIPTSLIPAILKSSADGGLKSILKKHDHSAVEIQVPDRHMLVDMNRIDDYENALLRHRNHDIPTEVECEVILKHVCPVSDDIAWHCRKVAQIARQICRALQKAGLVLNLDLVTAGALLHDVAKGQKNHATAGARLLSEMGFARIAQIVSRHTDLKPTPSPTLTEVEIVYMADKLVMKTRIVTLAERFEQALKRFGHEPEARTAILRRRETSLALKRKMECTAGVSIASITAS